MIPTLYIVLFTLLIVFILIMGGFVVARLRNHYVERCSGREIDELALSEFSDVSISEKANLSPVVPLKHKHKLAVKTILADGRSRTPGDHPQRMKQQQQLRMQQKMVNVNQIDLRQKDLLMHKMQRSNLHQIPAMKPPVIPRSDKRESVTPDLGTRDKDDIVIVNEVSDDDDDDTDTETVLSVPSSTATTSPVAESSSSVMTSRSNSLNLNDHSSFPSISISIDATVPHSHQQQRLKQYKNQPRPTPPPRTIVTRNHLYYV